MAAVVAHHPLGHAGGAGGVEDVERIGGGHRHAVGRRGAFARCAPVEIPAVDERSLGLRALEDDRPLRLVSRQLDGGVEQRLVGHHPVDLDAARSGQDQLRLRVVDAGGQLLRREAAEDHRVNRADPGAGQHADHRLGHHRHVDDHAIAGGHSLCGERAGDPRHLVAQLGEGEPAHGVRHRAVVDQRELPAAAAVDVAIEAVVAGVEPASSEPAVEGRIRVVAHRVPAPVPVQRFRGSGPEFPRVLLRSTVGVFVYGGHEAGSYRKGADVLTAPAVRAAEPAQTTQGAREARRPPLRPESCRPNAARPSQPDSTAPRRGWQAARRAGRRAPEVRRR